MERKEDHLIAVRLSSNTRGAQIMDEYVMKMKSRMRVNLSRCSSSRKLFLGNLCTVTVEELRTYCEKYGVMGDLSINRDKDQNVRSHDSEQQSCLPTFVARFTIALHLSLSNLLVRCRSL